MYKIAVCDDEVVEIEKIEYCLSKYSMLTNTELSIDRYQDPDALLDKYYKGKYNIIFLDIEMGKKDGLYIANKIRKTPDKDVVIIYVSAYPRYMQASFDVKAAQFFLKPLNYDVFEKKFSEILNYYFEEKDGVICFEKNNDEDVYVNEGDIISIEVNAKGKIKDYSVKCQRYMIMANRSTLFSSKYVCRIKGVVVVLKGNKEIVVSRKNISDVKKLIAQKEVSRII